MNGYLDFAFSRFQGTIRMRLLRYMLANKIYFSISEELFIISLKA